MNMARLILIVIINKNINLMNKVKLILLAVQMVQINKKVNKLTNNKWYNKQ